MIDKHAKRMELHQHLRAVLRAAAAERPRHLDNERLAVLFAANAWVDSHEGCRRVTAEDVARCDDSAAGHVDWIDKFPLYVSEYVYGLRGQS